MFIVAARNAAIIAGTWRHPITPWAIQLRIIWSCSCYECILIALITLVALVTLVTFVAFITFTIPFIAFGCNSGGGGGGDYPATSTAIVTIMSW